MRSRPATWSRRSARPRRPNPCCAQPFLPGRRRAVGGREAARARRGPQRALSALADASLRSGDAREAARWAEQAVALEPFRESGYRRLMEAHVAAGNRAEALRVYERCRRLLAEELGAYPSPETESVYRGFSKRRPSSRPRRPPSSDAPADESPARCSSRARVGAGLASFSDPDPTPSRPAGRGFARGDDRRRARGGAVGRFGVAAVFAVVIFAFGQGGRGAAPMEAAPGDSVGFVDPDSNRLVAESPSARLRRPSPQARVRSG